MFKVIIGRYLSIAIFLYLCSSLSLFLPFLKAFPLASLSDHVWWRCILLDFFLSGKVLIWPSILIKSLAGQSSLGCRPLVFITWNISCHSLLAWSISIEKSAASLIGAPLYVTSYFSLAAFKILSLSWNFAILIIMFLEVGLLGFLFIETLCASWVCVTFSLIKLGKFSVITFSNRFSIPCSSSSPSGIPIIRILLCFMLSCSSLDTSLFCLFSFSCSF
uniref:Uncharacterized protein n=1 Tax=Desmodus rotundus TaxID=9430 RepID=K9IHF4_DESRO